ncbi:MAG: hypothetical protein GY771_00940 [bacterium]|nr:hypothetical protein [bacterium]
MDWIIPILAVAIGIGIVVYLLIPKKRGMMKSNEDKAPLCPGCGVDSCPAMGGNDDVDIEAIRRKLAERAEKLTEQADNK